ncbi:hypothetical protein Leryth_015849 [Lithospermum erythrorhizon]|nr:hypothetical protein Leryth_015849 [Lithospermum erythrorhizon]
MSKRNGHNGTLELHIISPILCTGGTLKTLKHCSLKHLTQPNLKEYSRQQGLYGSTLMDIIVGFGDSWEFEPMELENPFPNGEGIVNLWQGDKDMAISVELQRHVVSKLPWINYHEIPDGGHTFSYEANMKDEILKALVGGAARISSSNNGTNVPIFTD